MLYDITVPVGRDRTKAGEHLAYIHAESKSEAADKFFATHPMAPTVVRVFETKQVPPKKGVLKFV